MFIIIESPITINKVKRNTMVAVIASEIIQYSIVQIFKNPKNIAKFFIKLTLEATNEYKTSRSPSTKTS